jgi:hypothetical protein
MMVSVSSFFFSFGFFHFISMPLDNRECSRTDLLANWSLPDSSGPWYAGLSYRLQSDFGLETTCKTGCEQTLTIQRRTRIEEIKAEDLE